MTNYLETGVVIKKDDGTEEVYQIPYNINNILIYIFYLINMSFNGKDVIQFYIFLFYYFIYFINIKQAPPQPS